MSKSYASPLSIKSFDLLKFSWTVLLPVSILNLFLMVILKYMGGLHV